jgi:hypothetical protein
MQMPWDCHLGSPHALGVEERSAAAHNHSAYTHAYYIWGWVGNKLIN